MLDCAEVVQRTLKGVLVVVRVVAVAADHLVVHQVDHEGGAAAVDLVEHRHVLAAVAVFHADQERFTLITVLLFDWMPDFWDGFKVSTKVKYIQDQDNRDLDLEYDNYMGNIITARLTTSIPLNDEITISASSRTAGVSAVGWML